ncbi:DNA-binding response regulator, partial [Chromobacterium piscinae]
MSAKRLAIIDDDEAVRQSLLWLLDGQGYQVDGFDSGEA